MMDVEIFMKAVERIEDKIDDIRETISGINIMANGTAIRQSTQEAEIKALKTEVNNLKSAYDKASGAWKLLSLPGILSAIYALSQFLQK